MVSFTPGHNWPIPSLADIADGPDAFSDALLAIETTFDADQVLAYTPVWTGSLANPANPSELVGRYRVQNGVCDLWVWIAFGASTTGGSGTLAVSVPITVRPELQAWLPCKLYVPHGAPNQYSGGAWITSGDSLGLHPLFPKSNTDTRVDNWTNESSIGSGAGTGTPQISGSWTVENGGNFTCSGRYPV